MTKEEVSIQFGVNDSAMDSQLARMTGKVDQSSMVMAESIVKSQTIAASQVLAVWKKTETDKAMMTIAQSEALNARLLAIDAAEAEEEKAITAAAVAEETALRLAAAKAQAAGQVAAYGEAMAAQAVIASAALAKISIGQQIARGEAAAKNAVGVGESLIPDNMAGGAARLAKEAEYAARLEAAGIASVKGAHSMSAGATVWRESAVLVREAARGNWTRMMGSATILIGAIGAVVGVATAVVAAADGIAELLGFNGIFRHIMDYRKAAAGRDESEKGLKDKTESTSEMGEKRVGALESAGIINKKQAEQFRQRLKDPNRTAESVGATYHEITKLMPSIGGKSGLDELEAFAENKKAKEKEAADIKRETDSASKELEGYNKKERTSAEIAADMAGRQESIAKLKERSAKLSADAPGKANLELNILLQQVEVEKDKVAQKEKQKELAEQAKAVSEAQLRADQIGQRHQESFMPTLQELSHAGGPFGSMARKAVQDEKKAKRDYMRGNIAGAHADIADRDKIYEKLSGAGVVSESPEAREIKDLNKQLAIHFAGMPGNPKNPAYITPKLK